MSQPIPSETIEYERFVGNLRAENALMRTALQKLIAKADDIIAAIDGTTGQFEPEVAALGSATSEAERLLKHHSCSAEGPKPITVHIEGGMVQDVSDVPNGYELHVEDHDIHDEEHPQWDAEKECIVTVHEGGAA
jgi:hypothetical protein